MSASAGPERRESGIATVALPMLVWVATLVAVVTIDVAAYLVAASRAQALADAAALAAVAADIRDVPGVAAPGRRTAAAEARRVVDAGAGRLETCLCRRGSEYARVTVSVVVPGLVIPSLGAGRVSAEAEAVLAPPDELSPGPWRERAAGGPPILLTGAPVRP